MDFGVFFLAAENIEEDGRSERMADKTHFALEIGVALMEEAVNSV